MMDIEPTGPESAPVPTPATPTKPDHPSWLPFAIDFGPLLIFFLLFKFMPRSDSAYAATSAAVTGTLGFMIAIVISVIISKWKLGKVSPMLWLSAVLVVGFGALTVYFHDEKFIQFKPTIIYASFALMLLGGWMRGKPLLKYLLQAAYDGLSEQGWMKLSRNWGLFFLGMTLANEVLRRMLTFDSWLTIKVWGVTAVSIIFAMSQLPMMMREGMTLDGPAGGDATKD